MFDSVDAHQDRVARIHAVSVAGVEVAGDRQPMKVRSFDERLEHFRRHTFRLEALRAQLCPMIDLGVDLLRRDLAIPSWTRSAEVRTRAQETRSGLLAVLDPHAKIVHR